MSRQTLDSIEVSPIAAVATPQAEAAAKAWLAARCNCRARVTSGEVFTAGGHDFAVSSPVPAGGAVLSAETKTSIGSIPVPLLLRLQLTYLDSTLVPSDADDALFKDFVRPYLEKLRDARRQEGGRYLIALSQDQVLSTATGDFGVRAIDPPGRCAALDSNTVVYVSQADTLSLGKVHVLPYEDTLPVAYSYDRFKDFLQPFFQAHPFAVYGVHDHFTYRGVRFRVMATDPPSVAGRVSNQTVVYSEGQALRPTLLDYIPAHLREDLRHLPRGLQMLLLNTMATDEAVRGRLQEMDEVLRPGQGLSTSDISSTGRTFEWRAAQQRGETQQQCMVCLAEFTDGESLRQLGCDHHFHRACIDEWLQRSAACPICKQGVSAGRHGRSDGGAEGGAVGSGAAGGAAALRNARVAFGGDCQGTVVGFDAARQRFQVVPDGGGPERLLAAEELVQPLAGIQLINLQTAEYNSMRVQIVGLDASRGRYQMRLDSGRVLAVRPENCVLPDGAIARVSGLRAEGAGTRWNGHYGRVLRFDHLRTRHILAMLPRGQLLSVKPQNLRV